jgi:5'-nucleotidase
MHILVTNDDGVQAPGLLALAQAMRGLGQVTVLAPERNWSACGHVKTLDRPLRVHETQLADGSLALTTDGAPSDCVALALLGIATQKIDLVVSGINPYANLGHDITYSGTVTAAMEAVIGGVMGVAVSLESNGRTRDYAPAANLAARLVSKLLHERLPEGVLLNMNVPCLPQEQIKGFQVTRQGMSIYRDVLDCRQDPRGQSYYWIGGDPPIGQPEDGTDFAALAAGYVSVTPLQLDLTAHKMLEKLQGWEWGR